MGMQHIRTQRLAHILKRLDLETGGGEVGDTALNAIGLKRAKLNTPDFTVSREQEVMLIDLGCEALKDNCFATRAGLSFHEANTLNAYIAKYSQTLREAIENSAQYFSILDSAFSLDLRISSNAASFGLTCLDPALARHHRFIEFIGFTALARMRSILQIRFFPLELRFEHQAKNSVAEISKLAGFPVIFGAERCELILSRASLETPIPTYDPSLREHLKEYANRLKQELALRNPGLRAQVESVLSANLPGRIVPAEEIAANLGMSRRTFARRLKDEGLGFREIVDELRCDLARTYLKEGFGISEISFYLDYGDQAAFSTAFKRWTGQSPRAYRSRYVKGMH